jgi:hypothetical protein
MHANSLQRFKAAPPEGGPVEATVGWGAGGDDAAAADGGEASWGTGGGGGGAW